MGKPRQTFHLAAPRDVLDMLEWQRSELLAVPSNQSYLAAYRMIQCSLTAWSICDWVYARIPTEQLGKYVSRDRRTERGFREWVMQQSPALRICRLIADSFKHEVISDKPEPQVTTEHLLLAYQDGSSAGFWSVLDEKGTIHPLPRLVNEAILFWSELLLSLNAYERSPSSRRHVPPSPNASAMYDVLKQYELKKDNKK